MVRGTGGHVVVSDDGGALSEISSAGIHGRPADRQIRSAVRMHGLKVKDGIIYSPPVPLSMVGAAIVIVANAAKEVADWGLQHLRYSVPRNFRQELALLLHSRFNENLKTDLPVVGASNKQHRFGHVIYLEHDAKILIDPVVNDSSSINARVVANLDVKMLNDEKTKQVIVYDDNQDWTSSDLNLLKVGAPIVAFSLVGRELEKLAA